MLNNYLVEDFFNELEGFTSFITLTASNIEPNYKNRPSVVAKDSALILSRLIYIESVQQRPSSKRRESWKQRHPNYIHQSYDQLTRWTGLNTNSINRSISYLTELGIIADKARDSSLYVKLNLNSFTDGFFAYVLSTESRRWWSNFKFVNTYLTLLHSLGSDTKARLSIEMLSYFSSREETSEKLTLKKMRDDLNETRDSVLKCIDTLKGRRLIDKNFCINLSNLQKMCTENKKFEKMLNALNDKKDHNIDRLRKNKHRLFYPLANDLITEWRKDNAIESNTDVHQLTYLIVQSLYENIYLDSYQTALREDSNGLYINYEGKELRFNKEIFKNSKASQFFNHLDEYNIHFTK